MMLQDDAEPPAEPQRPPFAAVSAVYYDSGSAAHLHDFDAST